MAMSKYQTVQWEREMKDEIKCEYNHRSLFSLLYYILTHDNLVALGRAVHGQSLSHDCVFDAISYKDETFVPTRPTYTSILILYTSSGSKSWRILATAEPFKFSSVDKSLEALLDELREQLGKEMSEFHEIYSTTLENFRTTMLT
jgi:hypothetical protein